MMDKSVYMFCKFNGDTYVMKVSGEYQFGELINNVCSNFGIVSVDKVTVRYSIPGKSRILLRKQEDLDLMLELATDLCLKSIEIDVDVDGGGVENGNGSVLSSSRVVNNISFSGVGCYVNDVNLSQPIFSTQAMYGDAINVSVCSNDFDNGLVVNEASTSRVRTSMSTSWIDGIKDVGQVFQGGVKEFRNALCRYSVELGFKFNYDKNTKEVVIASCCSKFTTDCKWYIFASISRVNGFFYIRKFVKEHTCGVLMANGDSKRISCSHMAELIFDEVRCNPGITAIELVRLIKKNFSLDISYRKAWTCLERAKAMIFGDQGDSYRCLRWYVDATLRTNEGSRVVLDVDNFSNRFRRLFVSFNASIIGFRFCRPLLFLDGTFLKGLFKGTMLAATAKDGNQGILFSNNVMLLCTVTYTVTLCTEIVIRVSLHNNFI